MTLKEFEELAKEDYRQAVYQFAVHWYNFAIKQEDGPNYVVNQLTEWFHYGSTPCGDCSVDVIRSAHTYADIWDKEPEFVPGLSSMLHIVITHTRFYELQHTSHDSTWKIVIYDLDLVVLRIYDGPFQEVVKAAYEELIR